jgi:pimeloyl-ACP methyl ester carboxylesterase
MSISTTGALDNDPGQKTGKPTPENKAFTSQPIVIFGGFLSFTMLYWRMRDTLAGISGQPVWIVETWGHDWLPSMTRVGWVYLLRKLDRTVQQASAGSDGGKITLVGHSAGGVLGRLYLSPNPLLGNTFGGINKVRHLITLGSPHHNRGGLMRGGSMSRWIEKRYPGAFFAPEVTYTSVAGKLVCGDHDGSRQERWAYNVYEEIGGDGRAWGDGLIPLESALLKGSHHVVLANVGHFSGFGQRWYGSQDVIPKWWHTRGSYL